MQINVNRNELATAVTYAKRVLPKYPNVPVLAGMRLEVTDGALVLSTFDYETSARLTVAGDGAEAGVILVTGHELADAVKVLPKGKNVRAELSATDAELVITCDGTVYRLAGLDLAEYPALPDVPAVSGVIDGEAFKRAVTRVAAAAGRDDTLPVLTCISVTTGPGALTLAATDRYRLAIDVLDWTPADLDGPKRQYLIPAQVIAEFAKKITGKVSVHFGDAAHLDPKSGGFGGSTYGFVALSDDTRTVTTRTSNGSFPRVDMLLRKDKSNATSVTVPAGELAAAVKAAGAMCDSYPTVRLSINAGVITVQATRDGTVAASRNVPASLGGEEILTAFNPVYLASMLAGVTGDATLRFDGAAKPVQISGAHDTFTALCMPIKLAA